MNRIRSVIANVLGVAEETIRNETKQSDIELWDSFSSLLLLSELERKFNVKFSLDETKKLNSVKGISVCLKSHDVELVDDE